MLLFNLLSSWLLNINIVTSGALIFVMLEPFLLLLNLEKIRKKHTKYVTKKNKIWISLPNYFAVTSPQSMSVLHSIKTLYLR